jgi:hypothetical protein
MLTELHVEEQKIGNAVGTLKAPKPVLRPEGDELQFVSKARGNSGPLACVSLWRYLRVEQSRRWRHIAMVWCDIALMGIVMALTLHLIWTKFN